MRQTNAIPALIFVVIAGLGLALAYAPYAASDYVASFAIMAASVVVTIVASSATEIANQWEGTIVLRLGRFLSMRSPRWPSFSGSLA